MSKIRASQIEMNVLNRGVTEFVFKIECNDGKELGNILLGEEGVYYYTTGSQIITPRDRNETRETWDGFLSFEKLKDIFDKLQEIGWTLADQDDSLINISVSDGKIIIEIQR